jgi:hypothetical protein
VPLGSRVRFMAGTKIFLFTASRVIIGCTQPPVQWIPSPEVKLTVEVKNAWSYTSTSKYILMACSSVKHEVRLR